MLKQWLRLVVELGFIRSPEWDIAHHRVSVIRRVEPGILEIGDVWMYDIWLCTARVEGPVLTLASGTRVIACR